MPTDEELTYADHVGRFYVRYYAYPPMVGRLLGYLSICDPRDQSIGELADALLASRSAITGAVKVLEHQGVVRRTRAAGQRMDRIRLDLSSPQAKGFDLAMFEEMAELAREGLKVLEGASAERRALMQGIAAFADFALERMANLQQEWEAHLEALIAAGELPAETRP
jgi:DNA-binding MarR family transcriptional regulator